jgi:hypothetical protein
MEAREVVLRGFDLLATPPTDIQAARVAIWNTSSDIFTRDGRHELLGHLDDQHDCTFSEWLFPWEEECPDDDGAVWVGVLPNAASGGVAQGYHPFNESRDTLITSTDRLTAAHEMGHTLKLNHVDAGVICGTPHDEDDSFDTLPDSGAIRRGDPFDPHTGKVVEVLGPGALGTFDMMSYACKRWVSRTNWQRVFDKF